MSNRAKTNLFKIDGMPMVVPDHGVPFSYEDIDSADTGRDETGRMHRDVVLFKVGKWAFSYTEISLEDYTYLESLFGNKSSFTFTRPSRTNPAVSESTECYRSKYSMNAENLAKQKWVSYVFDIIEM